MKNRQKYNTALLLSADQTAMIKALEEWFSITSVTKSSFGTTLRNTSTCNL